MTDYVLRINTEFPQYNPDIVRDYAMATAFDDDADDIASVSVATCITVLHCVPVASVYRVRSFITRLSSE